MAMCDNNNHKRNGERTIYVVIRAPKPWMKIIALAVIAILFVVGSPKRPVDPKYVHDAISVVMDKYVPDPIRKKIEPRVQKGADVIIVVLGTALAEPQTISVPSK